MMQFIVRNTPTCVGKTARKELHRSPREKHPHMRGEDKLPTNKKRSFMETPPHAWGRRGGDKSPRIIVGNTPTCVGKTLTPRHRVCVPQKHPHMRGEDSIKQFGEPRKLETPPHAWGRPIKK